MPTMPDPILGDLTELKLHLGITGAGEDSLLTQLLHQMDDVFWQFTKRRSAEFLSSEQTEYYSGAGFASIPLRRRPATAVANVWLDGGGRFGQGVDAFPASSLLTSGEDYYVETLEERKDNPSLLHYAGAAYLSDERDVSLGGLDAQFGAGWPIGTGNVKVQYTAGWTAVPNDIRLAIYTLAGMVKKGAEQQTGILKSERFGRYAYQLMSAGDEGETPGIGTVRSIFTSWKEPVA